MLPIKKIIYPTDFSVPSLLALDAACEYAQHFGAELKILHVLPYAPTISSTMMPLSVTPRLPSEEERRSYTESQIRDLIKERVPKDLTPTVQVTIGDAPSEIVRIANEDDADLIVIGTHGERGWRFLALGSVAAKVVRIAHRPVLTISSPKPED